MLEVFYFNKHCSCHFQGESVLRVLVALYTACSSSQVGSHDWQQNRGTGCYTTGSKNVVAKKKVK
jgi:hypothetical protein